MNGNKQTINIYTTSPNQRVICFHNDSLERAERAKKEKQENYDCVIHAIDSAAMRALSSDEYKMYSYLRKNKDGITLALSPDDACKYTGLKEKAYRKAVKGLINKGYLQQRSKPRNMYDFYVHIIDQQRNDNTPLLSVTSTPNGSMDMPITELSISDYRSIDTPEKGGEIIQENIINSTVKSTINNTFNSIENNTSAMEEKDCIMRVAKAFNLTEEQARHLTTKTGGKKIINVNNDDDLPF